MTSGKIIVFTCNWNGYSLLEQAGRSKTAYPPDVRPVRVACLGDLHPGIILKAFEYGAAGVMVLGCPPDACHYDFGSRKAEAIFSQTKVLLHLLGIGETRFLLDTAPAGDESAFVEKVAAFISGINGASQVL